jgi:hypothetical protein
VAGLERRRALINGQFMHEMSGEDQRKKMGEPPLVQFLKPKQEEENVVLKQALKDTTPKPGSRVRKPKPSNKVAQARAASDALAA